MNVALLLCYFIWFFVFQYYNEAPVEPPPAFGQHGYDHGYGPSYNGKFNNYITFIVNYLCSWMALWFLSGDETLDTLYARMRELQDKVDLLENKWIDERASPEPPETKVVSSSLWFYNYSHSKLILTVLCFYRCCARTC